MPQRKVVIRTIEGEHGEGAPRVVIRKRVEKRADGSTKVTVSEGAGVDLDDLEGLVEEFEEDGAWVLKVKVPKVREESLRPASGVSGAIGDLEGKLRELVLEARAQGYSWTQIGQALGTSKQAAWERFSGEE